MYVRLLLQICQRRSNSLDYFFTVCEVLLAGDFCWSSKRRYGAETYLQIIQPIGNKRWHFIENRIIPRPFSNSTLMSYQQEPDLSRETVHLRCLPAYGFHGILRLCLGV